MANHRISILIADDYPVFRGGLRNFLHHDRELDIVGEAGDGEQAITLVDELKPDVLLLDDSMPKLSGTETLQRLNELASTTRVLLMLDSYERPRMVEALHAGARGLLAKSSDQVVFLKAIRCVHKGELWVERDVLGDWATSTVRVSKAKLQLTSRERDIVREILAGSSNRDIASRFTITEHTVKRHLTNIYDKLGCANRLELCLFAMHNHLLAAE